MKRSEKGFSTLELVLVLVVVGLIGFTGWYVWRAKQNVDNLAQSPNINSVQTKNIAANRGVYKGWKTYESPIEKFSFKYPSNWVVRTVTADGNLKESVHIDGPNSFTLTYSLLAGGNDSNALTPIDHVKRDAGPYSYDPNENVYKGATLLNVKNFGRSLYIVVDESPYNGNKTTQSIGIAETKTYTEQKYLYPLEYAAKYGSGFRVGWSGAYSATAQGGPLALSYETFISKPEVKTAKLILESISY